MRRTILELVGSALLTGCTVASATSSPTASPASVQPPRSPAASVSATSPSPVPELASVLPAAFGEVEAHTFPVAQDLLGRLAASLGVAAGDLEVAYASEHGARFVQMLAVRAPGVPPDRLLEMIDEVAYPPVEPDALEIATDMLGAAQVLRIHHAGLAPRLGTFYALVRDAALIVVEAFDREVADAAIEALP